MPSDAKTLALRWLSQRSLSIQEVRDRLLARGVATDEVEVAIGQLRASGLLDDERLAVHIVEQSVGRHEGPVRIAQRLRARGINRDATTAALSNLREGTDWLNVAQLLGQRYDIKDPKARARLMRRMAREGFPGSVIRQLTNREGSDEDGIEDY